MPTIPVYIRKEDYAKFIEVYSPEWLHEKIHERVSSQPLAVRTSETPKDRLSTSPNQELPCCQNRQPCKHWTWDGVKQTYTNSISGRVVEVAP